MGAAEVVENVGKRANETVVAVAMNGRTVDGRTAGERW